MPALALTDLANLFGMVKFYTGGARRGHQADRRRRRLGRRRATARDPGRDGASRLLLLVKNRGRLPAAVRVADCRLPAAAPPWPRRGQPRRHRQWRQQRADCPFRRAGGRRGPVAAGRQDRQGPGARPGLGATVSGQLLPRSAALRPGATGDAGRRHRGAGRRGSTCRWWRPIRCSSSARDDFKAHEARVCIAEGYVLADTRRPKQFTEEQYFKTQAEMAELFADLPEALENSVEIARRCNLTVQLGKSRLPIFPTPGGRVARRLPGQPVARRPGAAPAAVCSPIRRSATCSDPATPSGWSSRSRPSSRWASPATS